MICFDVRRPGHAAVLAGAWIRVGGWSCHVNNACFWVSCCQIAGCSACVVAQYIHYFLIIIGIFYL